MKNYKLYMIQAMMLLSGGIMAQDQDIKKELQLVDAIGIALENNYDVKIARNNLEQSENNKFVGNAGFLPSVAVQGGADYSGTDTELELLGYDDRIVVDDANSLGLSANVSMDYVLFNGMGRIYTLDKLQESNVQQQHLLRNQMENSVMQVIQAYYELAMAQQNLELTSHSLEISRDRFQKATDRRQFGQATSLDVMNAEVDRNSDSTRVLIAAQNREMAIKNLNLVLGIPMESTYSIDSEVDLDQIFNKPEVLRKVEANNSALLSQLTIEQIAKMDLKITKSKRYPTISAYGGYAYNQQENEAGQMLYNRSTGWNGGVRLKLDVFTGGKQTIAERNARLHYDSEQERSEKFKAQLERDAENAYTDYDYKKRIVTLQESSLAQAEANFEHSKSLFDLGQINSVEFRAAQQNLIDVANKYNEALFSAKIAEYQLLQLMGDLLRKNES